MPISAALVRSAADAATRALSQHDASAGFDIAAALRHLLVCPSLRDVASKVSRLRSLALVVIGAASQTSDVTRGDAAAAALLEVLHEAGVDITAAGLRDESTTPLIAALQRSFLRAAQVLLDAGADVNESTANGVAWPLGVAAVSRSGVGIAWLLDHGISLSYANCLGRNVAHVLATGRCLPTPRPW